VTVAAVAISRKNSSAGSTGPGGISIPPPPTPVPTGSAGQLPQEPESTPSPKVALASEASRFSGAWDQRVREAGSVDEVNQLLMERDVLADALEKEGIDIWPRKIRALSTPTPTPTPPPPPPAEKEETGQSGRREPGRTEDPDDDTIPPPNGKAPGGKENAETEGNDGTAEEETDPNSGTTLDPSEEEDIWTSTPQSNE